jgi:hypothetical protein
MGTTTKMCHVIFIFLSGRNVFILLFVDVASTNAVIIIRKQSYDINWPMHLLWISNFTTAAAATTRKMVGVRTRSPHSRSQRYGVKHHPPPPVIESFQLKEFLTIQNQRYLHKNRLVEIVHFRNQFPRLKSSASSKQLGHSKPNKEFMKEWRLSRGDRRSMASTKTLTFSPAADAVVIYLIRSR